MSHVDKVIKLMGYSDSSNLKYMRDGIDINVYTAHVNKILSELSPYAVYMIDNQPFVLFLKRCQIRTVKTLISKDLERSDSGCCYM